MTKLNFLRSFLHQSDGAWYVLPWNCQKGRSLFHGI